LVVLRGDQPVLLVGCFGTGEEEDRKKVEKKKEGLNTDTRGETKNTEGTS